MEGSNERETSETENRPGRWEHFNVRIREMPILLGITFFTFSVLPIVFALCLEALLISEFASYSRRFLLSDLRLFAIPLMFVSVLTISGLIYWRPVFARSGLVVLFITFCLLLLQVTTMSIWGDLLLVIHWVGIPIYYLYFRKNVVAYFKQGRKVKG